MPNTIEVEVIRKLRERTTHGELNGINVTYRVTGGAPGEHLVDEEIHLTGLGSMTARLRTSAEGTRESSESLTAAEVKESLGWVFCLLCFGLLVNRGELAAQSRRQRHPAHWESSGGGSTTRPDTSKTICQSDTGGADRPSFNSITKVAIRVAHKRIVAATHLRVRTTCRADATWILSRSRIPKSLALAAPPPVTLCNDRHLEFPFVE
jgi:hypothetical protein